MKQLILCLFTFAVLTSCSNEENVNQETMDKNISIIENENSLTKGDLFEYQKFSNDKELIILSNQFRAIYSKPYDRNTFLLDLQKFNANLAKFKTKYSKYDEFLNIKVKEENDRLSRLATPGCGKRPRNENGTTNSECCSTWEHIQVAFVAGIGCVLEVVTLHIV
ncbi:MAG: hypothetical protein HC854_02785 [Flavobacterium sp.]|nr:hypothetical protein [Flavobacterium sp.]